MGLRSFALENGQAQKFISNKEGGMKMLGGGGGRGAEIWCVSSGVLKNRWGQGEGVKSSYRTKDLITWAGLAPFAEIPAP